MDCCNLASSLSSMIFPLLLSHAVLTAFPFSGLLSPSLLSSALFLRQVLSLLPLFSLVCVFFSWLYVLSQRALSNAKAGRRSVTLWMHKTRKENVWEGKNKKGKNKGIPGNVTVFDAFWALTYINNDSHPRVCTLYIVLQRGLCSCTVLFVV